MKKSTSCQEEVEKEAWKLIQRYGLSAAETEARAKRNTISDIIESTSRFDSDLIQEKYAEMNFWYAVANEIKCW